MKMKKEKKKEMKKKRKENEPCAECALLYLMNGALRG